MSASSYKFIYVFIALIVIPGAIIAPLMFAKMGPALCAVLANLLTGAVTIVLLQIGQQGSLMVLTRIDLAFAKSSWPAANNKANYKNQFYKIGARLLEENVEESHRDL